MKYKYVLISGNFPSLTGIKEPVIIGTFSWILMKTKQRWIAEKSIVDVGNGIQTAPEVARDYIDAAFPRKLRAYADQIPFIKQHRSAVLYAKVGRTIKGVYLDVSAAYWSILRVTGYNVDYFPNKWLLQGRHMEDFPLPHHKVARSSLVSLGLVHPMSMWTGEKMKEVKKGNPRVNFGLWAIVQDVLHGIAVDLKNECGLMYGHTDGFIVPYHQMDRAIQIISERWGMPVKVKTNDAGDKAIGLAVVLGVGRYKVGNVETKNVLSPPSDDFSNLQSLVDPVWLSERIRHFIVLRGQLKRRELGL